MSFVWEVITSDRARERLSQPVDRVEPWVDGDVRGVDGEDVRTRGQVVHGVGDAGADQVDTLNVLYRRGQVEDVAVS